MQQMLAHQFGASESQLYLMSRSGSPSEVYKSLIRVNGTEPLNLLLMIIFCFLRIEQWVQMCDYNYIYFCWLRHFFGTNSAYFTCIFIAINLYCYIQVTEFYICHIRIAITILVGKFMKPFSLSINIL